MSNFKVPAAWGTGLAIPQNIRDEGLRQGAYVTKWAPRGSYDDPDPFDPSWDKSYAIPQYVLDEGYGQGAEVTKWLPRGYYDGSTGRARARAGGGGLGDDAALPAPIAGYGQRAAAAIMRRMAQVPPGARKEYLRGVLNAIDPTLWGRTERLANGYVQRGMPPMQAVQVALGEAMSRGLVGELRDIGIKSARRAPNRGQVGLGCYGRRRPAALGNTAPRAAITTSPLAVKTTAPALTAGMCSSDGTHVWAVGTDGVGYWRRRGAGEGCAGTWGSSPTTGGAQGGISGEGKAAGTAPTLDLKLLQVGPFTIPLAADRFTIKWRGPLPAEWQSFIVAQLSKGTTDRPVQAGKIYGRLRDFLPMVPSKVNDDFIAYDREDWKQQPIVAVKRPDTGEEWGLYARIRPMKPDQPFDSTTNPYVFEMLWKKPDTGIWDWIKRMVGKVVDFAKEVLDTVGGIACTLLSSSGAPIAAGAAGGPAAAQGAAIAQQSCGQPPPGDGSAGGDFPILPVAIAGGALLAVAALWPKKR